MTTKSDKIKQIQNEKRNTETGLTPIQEQTALMMASGESVSSIAEKMSLSRSTIYQWQSLTTFQCFYNQRCFDIREHLENSLLSMYNDAIAAIAASLKSKNESVKLNTAKWLVENIENMRIGETNAKEAFKKECTYNGWNGEVFEEDKYKELLQKNGIEEDEE